MVADVRLLLADYYKRNHAEQQCSPRTDRVEVELVVFNDPLSLMNFHPGNQYNNSQEQQHCYIRK